MSLIDSFDLADYKTREEIEELLNTIEYEQSTLRGFERGAREKIVSLDETEDEPPLVDWVRPTVPFISERKRKKLDG